MFVVPRGDLHLDRQDLVVVVQLPEVDCAAAQPLGVDRSSLGGEVDGLGGGLGCGLTEAAADDEQGEDGEAWRGGHARPEGKGKGRAEDVGQKLRLGWSIRLYNMFCCHYFDRTFSLIPTNGT